MSTLVAGSANPFSGSSVTTGVSPLAPVAEAGGSGVPIDPVLLAESQSQLSLHPSQVPPPLLRGQNASSGDRSKSQVTGIDIPTNGTLDSDSGDDSEDDDEAEYESDGSDSDDGSEPVLLSHSKAQVRNSFPVNAQDQDPDNSCDLHDFHDNAKNPNHGGQPDNDGYQDIGAEYSTHHHFQDPTLGEFRFYETRPSFYLYSARL
jgi:hypothetical protein